MTTTTIYGDKNPTLFSIVTTNYAAQTNYPLSVVVTGNNTNNTCIILPETGSSCSVQITLTASYAGGNGQDVTYSWSSDNYLIFIDPSTNQTTTTGQQVLINNYKTEGVYSYAITCTATQGTNTATAVFYWKSTHTKPPVVATISRVANAPTTCTYNYNTGSTISSTLTCEVLDQWEAIINEQQSPAGTASYLWSWNNLQAPSGFSLVNTTSRIVTVKSTGVSGGYTIPAGSLKCTITKGNSTTTFSNTSDIIHSHYAKYYPYATPNIESNSQQWGSIDSDATVFVKYLKNAEWFTPSNTIIYPLPVGATWSRTGIDTGDSSNYATSGTVNSSGQISALSPVLKSFTSFSMIYTISMPQYTLLANTDSNGKFKHTWVGKQLQWSKPSLLDPDYVEGQSITATLDISNNNYDSTLNKISSDGSTLFWHLFQYSNGNYTKLDFTNTRFAAVYGFMSTGTNQGNNLFRYIPNPAITSQNNNVTNTAETFAVALYAGTAVANRTWANAAATSGTFTLIDNNYTFSANNVTDWDAGTRNINSEITRTITVSNFGFSGKIAVRVFAQSGYVLTNPIDVEIRVDDWYASQYITSGGTSYTSYKTYDVTPATASFNIPIGLTIKQAGLYRGNITLTTYNTGSTIVGNNYSFNWVINTAEASDFTPNAYDFTDKTGQEINTVVESNEITISGLNAATPVSITTSDSSFQYILRQASTATNPESRSTGWISSDRNIRNGDTIKLRLTTSSSYAASKVMNVTIGTVTDTWTVTTRAVDTSPSGFTWVNNVTNAEVNTDYDAQYVVAGVDSGVNIPLNKAALPGITFVGTLLTETWNGSSYGALTERTSLPVNVQLNDRITLRIRSSSSYSTAVGCSVTLGGQEAGRTVLTKAQPIDRNPDAFSFITQTELALNTSYNSNVITPSGFTNAADISVSGTGSPEYKIYNSTGGVIQDWSSTTGTQTFLPGYQVQLRATTSANYGTSRTITLTIGTTSGTWTITSTPDYYPDVFLFIALSNQERSTVVTSNEVTIGGLTASGDSGAPASIQIIPSNLSIRVKPSNGVYSAWSTSTLWATNGTTIQAQLTTSSSFSTTVSGTVQAGFNNPVSFFATTRAASTAPDSFSITSVTGANLSTVVESPTIVTISGLEQTVTITSSNCEFSLLDVNNNVTTWGTSVQIGNGTKFKVRMTSSASYSTGITGSVTVGTGSAVSWTVTTKDAPDRTPDDFVFADVENASRSTWTTSPTTVTVSGITSGETISLYSYYPAQVTILDPNGNETTWGYGGQNVLVGLGWKIRSRIYSSSAYSDAVEGTVYIGGVSNTWSVTTAAPPPPPASITAISWSSNPITVGSSSTFNVTFDKSTYWHWEIRDSSNQQVYTRPAWGGPGTTIAETYTFNTAGTYTGNAAAQNPEGTAAGASITVNPPPPPVTPPPPTTYSPEIIFRNKTGSAVQGLEPGSTTRWIVCTSNYGSDGRVEFYAYGGQPYATFSFSGFTTGTGQFNADGVWVNDGGGQGYLASSFNFSMAWVFTWPANHSPASQELEWLPTYCVDSGSGGGA